MIELYCRGDQEKPWGAKRIQEERGRNDGEPGGARGARKSQGGRGEAIESQARQGESEPGGALGRQEPQEDPGGARENLYRRPTITPPTPTGEWGGDFGAGWATNPGPCRLVVICSSLLQKSIQGRIRKKSDENVLA